jgi:glycosyltransferase involved in cell wall biosynthesis
MTLHANMSAADAVTPHFESDPAHPFIPPAFQRLRARRANNRRAMRSKPRILQLIGSLGGGGSERQLSNLVVQLTAKGHDVRVLSLEPLVGQHAFYLPLLKNYGVPVRSLRRCPEPELKLRLSDIADGQALHAELPNWLRPWSLEVLLELLADPPDILHAWLDFTNITGAIAALAAGVPRIILSTRSVNPTHFAYLNTRWFHPWYQFLASIEDLALLNNSVAGQHDYAQWLNIPSSRFRVIRNGIDPSVCCQPTAGDIERLRRELRLEPQEMLIAGIYRLSAEKRPFLFLDVVQQVMQQNRLAHVAIAGTGPLEAELRACVAASPFANRIHLLGLRSDIPSLIGASATLLQTSIIEGTPNTLLEAQALGCPVVTTPAGGAAEAVSDGHTGFVASSTPDLVLAVTRILGEPRLRDHFSQNGPGFIGNQFGLNQMVDAHIKLYEGDVGCPR